MYLLDNIYNFILANIIWLKWNFSFVFPIRIFFPDLFIFSTLAWRLKSDTWFHEENPVYGPGRPTGRGYEKCDVVVLVHLHRVPAGRQPRMRKGPGRDIPPGHFSLKYRLQSEIAGAFGIYCLTNCGAGSLQDRPGMPCRITGIRRVLRAFRKRS